MPNPKLAIALTALAFVCSTILVGISIGTIYFASDAYDIFTARFPPGSYGWSPSHWYGDDKAGWRIFINYNRSSEIKTYVAATSTLIVGLFGTFAFGLSFQVNMLHPIAPLLHIQLLGSAALACFVAIICAVWSAVAEVNIKHSTCWFEPAVAGGRYSCSTENSACNALRFTDEATSNFDFEVLNKACLQFRHARYFVIPLAAVSLLLAGLYGTHVWLVQDKKNGRANAVARVQALMQDE